VIIPLLFEKYNVANDTGEEERESNTLTVEDWELTFNANRNIKKYKKFLIIILLLYNT
jgi:hypothetical protein